MYLIPPVIAVIAALFVPATPAHASGAGEQIPQQMQLNRASQQELKEIQDNPLPPPQTPPFSREIQQRQLERQQVVEQQLLQEQQRRELLLRNPRIRSMPPPQQRLDAIHQQRTFQRQQQYQLNRFRLERGPLSR